MKPNDPAYPIFNANAEINYHGLTKREYVATQMLNAFISCGRIAGRMSIDGKEVHEPAEFAQLAVMFTDALIEELVK